MPPRKSKNTTLRSFKDVAPSSQEAVPPKHLPKRTHFVPIPPPPTLSQAPKKREQSDDRLWTDVYSPKTEHQLSVHKKKINAVRGWLLDAFEGLELKKYRKLLILSGPAGCGKTATLRVLSRELRFRILEWQNSSEDAFGDDNYDSLSGKFVAFMGRASEFTPLPSSLESPQSHLGRQVILLEDLPNLLHGPTLQIFQNAITQHIETSDVPLVIIISDLGSRGEHKDEEGRFSRQTDTINVRTVVPPSLAQSPYITQIEFNPIAPTLMRQGLKQLVESHYGDSPDGRPTKETIELIVESSNGDIRNAIISLQFTSTTLADAKKQRKKKSSNLIALITRREHSLALFHLLGKILYNKRSGDPISESLSKKEQDRERELDKSLQPGLPLPLHHFQFQRRTSRVDIEMLYADSPVDTSLLSLYLHQNYHQFCEEVEQCDGVIDALSSIDSMSELWDSRGQVASEKFHIMTRGSLLALPSPVPRQNQKFHKPAFFENLKQTQHGMDDVLSVQDWLASCGVFWDRDTIRLNLPIMLTHAGRTDSLQQIPYHASFSKLTWSRDSSVIMASLDEGDQDLEVPPPQSRHETARSQNDELVMTDTKFWLETDDIAEF
ncbi:Cell cycle checkpoint protein rad17 [Serendipita sp. 396]|nr:Cell cycle checkpoint protein rad17 [Serendipita sp. 396]KAG8789324.1 Cell cycle checkpoint protein rad17 [Serendipita sp. 397]KAG8804558.1 Cell cycle checkpoint protein rad17 [Serendipita sp. 398]